MGLTQRTRTAGNPCVVSLQPPRLEPPFRNGAPDEPADTLRHPKQRAPFRGLFFAGGLRRYFKDFILK